MPLPVSAVARTIDTNLKGHYSLRATYSAAVDECFMSWRILKLANRPAPNLVLEQVASYSYCGMSFDIARSTHVMVLRELFKDFSPEAVLSVTTSGLRGLDGSGQWNVLIAEAAIESEEWQDYRLHYPKHRSKLSLNQIFLKLALSKKPYGDFEEMFARLRIPLELKNAEKILTASLGDRGLIGRIDTSIPLDTKVIIDAGILHWERKN